MKLRAFCRGLWLRGLGEVEVGLGVVRLKSRLRRWQWWIGRIYETCGGLGRKGGGESVEFTH